MEGPYVYAVAEGRTKPRERRQSRIRTSFFGSSKHGSVDLSADKVERSPSRLTLNGGEDGEGDSFFDRRKLRKAGSKISLRSMPSMPIVENPNEERTGYKALSDLLRGGRLPYAPRRNPISKPFNFSHITHANSQDFNRLHQAPQQELLADFNKVVRDSSLPLRRRATTTECEETFQPSATSPTWASRQRSSSFQTISERRRAGSNKSISPCEPLSEPTMAAAASEDGMRYACPLTPPLRTSSRHFLRSLQESPAEDGADEEGGEVIPPHAVTTECSYGARSACVEKGFMVPAPVSMAVGDDQERAELRAYRSAPDMSTVRQRSLRSPRCRPLSQLSQASDTLNGSFTVPSTPSQPMPGCRASSQLSVMTLASGVPSSDLDSCLDSWEQDIDWCYENQADADCEFDREECGLQMVEEVTAVVAGCSEASDLPMPLRESPFRSEQRKRPDSKEQFVFVDKRLTGTFEDKLLLPPTPRMSFIPPGQYEPVATATTIGVADGGFEPDHETIILRAADTALRHRSLSTSTSQQDMAPGRAYRDELARVARKLDEHIAALNMDMPISPPPSLSSSSSPSFRSPPLMPSPSPFPGNRSRADSQATCVTLCSDTETVTPTDSVEIVTPCSSAHSSVHMLQFLRAEKGLSFAAAALPGVVEFGPDGIVEGVPDEFVHFI